MKAIQQKFDLKDPPKHGGLRKNSGRKKNLMAHTAREVLTGKHPLHVTFKINKGLPSLRRKFFYQSFKKAVIKAQSKGLRLLQFSIQTNHVHMICEINDNETLHHAFKSLNTSFAKRVNAILNRAGAVLKERFHMHVLKTPTEFKNALKYVVLNLFKHDKNRPHIDLYSSAPIFADFDVLLTKTEYKNLKKVPIDDVLLSLDSLEAMLSAPSFWLSRIGWQKAIPRWGWQTV